MNNPANRTDQLSRINFLGWDCEIHISRQENGQPAIRLVTPQGEPVATATVRIPEAELADDEVLIKDYSENSGILEALIRAGVVEDTGRFVRSGYAVLPVCRLSEAALALANRQ